MGNFRFYKRAQSFPGLSVNISKSGPSLSFGVRGARVTVGSRGVTRTIGLPGSGLYWTSRSGNHTGLHSGRVEAPIRPGAQQQAHCSAAGAMVLIGVVLLALVVAFPILLLVPVAIGLVTLGARRR